MRLGRGFAEVEAPRPKTPAKMASGSGRELRPQLGPILAACPAVAGVGVSCSPSRTPTAAGNRSPCLTARFRYCR